MRRLLDALYIGLAWFAFPLSLLVSLFSLPFRGGPGHPAMLAAPAVGGVLLVCRLAITQQGRSLPTRAGLMTGLIFIFFVVVILLALLVAVGGVC